MTLTKSIVLSRYKENVGWVCDYDDEDLQIFIYNKGITSSNVKSKNIKTINRPNLGRESESFLYHIVENYDNLSDLIVFTQAWPFDNIPSFFDYIDNDLMLEKAENYFNWYGEKYKTCDENGAPEIYPISSGHPNKFNRTLKIIYEETFEKECPKEIRFKSNGSFCVTKDLVLKNKKEIYEKLIKFLIYEEQVDYDGIFKYNPYEGHIIERMWGLIFDAV
jgi:hypothetical protein